MKMLTHSFPYFSAREVREIAMKVAGNEMTLDELHDFIKKEQRIISNHAKPQNSTMSAILNVMIKNGNLVITEPFHRIAFLGDVVAGFKISRATGKPIMDLQQYYWKKTKVLIKL